MTLLRCFSCSSVGNFSIAGLCSAFYLPWEYLLIFLLLWLHLCMFHTQTSWERLLLAQLVKSSLERRATLPGHHTGPGQPLGQDGWVTWGISIRNPFLPAQKTVVVERHSTTCAVGWCHILSPMLWTREWNVSSITHCWKQLYAIFGSRKKYLAKFKPNKTHITCIIKMHTNSVLRVPTRTPTSWKRNIILKN